VDQETIALAHAATQQVLLTLKTSVTKPWLGRLLGKDVLCLAAGGG
jgi:hypothetical protein